MSLQGTVGKTKSAAAGAVVHVKPHNADALKLKAGDGKVEFGVAVSKEKTADGTDFYARPANKVAITADNFAGFTRYEENTATENAGYVDSDYDDRCGVVSFGRIYVAVKPATSPVTAGNKLYIEAATGFATDSTGVLIPDTEAEVLKYYAPDNIALVELKKYI